MNEIIINLHMHTLFSDGTGTHQDIAMAAMDAGIDCVLVTDHNVLVDGVQKYYSRGDEKVLLLVGEEVHDQTRDPQKNHLLVFGVSREMAGFAKDPQHLINMVKQEGGLSFIAHPDDPSAPLFNETDITWDDWDVIGFTGIELWNGLSEFKSLLNSRLRAVYYAYFPDRIAYGPFPRTISRWDQLLSEGNKIVALGGSDAHSLNIKMGPLTRQIFPYEFHFQSINTHLLLPGALTGLFAEDQSLVLNAIRNGRAFIGYDLPHSTRGFRFTAHGMEHSAVMGESISARRGITMQINLPIPAECLLIHNGKIIQRWHDLKAHTYITSETGAYRVEAYINFNGKRRAWIFSNPIYVM